jgi:hypothetical protein
MEELVYNVLKRASTWDVGFVDRDDLRRLVDAWAVDVETAFTLGIRAAQGAREYWRPATPRPALYGRSTWNP